MGLSGLWGWGLTAFTSSSGLNGFNLTDLINGLFSQSRDRDDLQNTQSDGVMAVVAGNGEASSLSRRHKHKEGDQFCGIDSVMYSNGNKLSV